MASISKKSLPSCVVMMSKQQWSSLSKAIRDKKIKLPGKRITVLTK